MTTLLEQFKSVKSIYESLITDKGNEIIKEMIEELVTKYPEFNTGVIRGGTPEWNDGEACEHSSDIFVIYLDEIDDLHDILGVPEDTVFNDNLAHSDARVIERELDLVDVILEEIHGTNYELAFTVIDGKIKVVFNDWDCGY